MHQPLVCLLAALLLPAGVLAADAPPAKTPPRIIIKVDDFGPGNSPNVSPQWQRLADFIKERKIKANIGVVCNGLEANRPNFLQWTRDLQATGLVEFWLHAYEHKSWVGPDGGEHNEFAGRPYEEEVQRLALCEKLARDRLGLVFHTFGAPGTGAPGPGVDDAAYKAIGANPDLKVWLYGSPLDDAGKALAAAGKITILDRVWQVNIEHPLFKPSADEFEKGYAKFAGQRDYFVIQGHPQHWTDEGFAEFVKIVDFATAQGCEFVLASEYAASHH